MNEDWTAKVCDEIKRVNPLGVDEPRRTVDYVGPQLVVFTVHRPDGPSQHCREITQFHADYEMAPQVFEEGKIYVLTANGVQVECLYADDTVALLVNQAGAKYLRSQDSRADYAEV